jgi:Ca2+-transporting ATPase
MALAGIIAGKKILLTIETAIALAAAAVPEGLQIVGKLRWLGGCGASQGGMRW